MFEALSTVFLIGRDLAASRRFYTEILRLEEASVQRDHVRYRVGETFLVLHAPIADEEMRAWGLDPLRELRGSGVVLTLRAADVDAAYRELSARGAEVLFPPRDAPWGVRMFMVRDPDGFLLEVSRPLGG